MNKASLRNINFLKREDGVTSIEYALIAGMVALAIIVGATSIGTTLSSTYNSVAASI